MASLAVKLTEPEKRRVTQKGTESVAAYDLYLKGRNQESAFTRSANADALRYYEQAIALDPGYSDAYARMANIYEQNAQYGWADDARQAMARGMELAEKAIALDDKNPFAYWTLGRIAPRSILSHADGIERGIMASERAIELDPNYADAHALRSYHHSGTGRIKDALKSTAKEAAIHSRSKTVNTAIQSSPSLNAVSSRPIAPGRAKSDRRTASPM